MVQCNPLPPSHLQSLVDRTVVGILGLARKEGYVRIQTISALLHTSSFLPRVQVSAPKGPRGGFNHVSNLGGVSLDGPEHAPL